MDDRLDALIKILDLLLNVFFNLCFHTRSGIVIQKKKHESINMGFCHHEPPIGRSEVVSSLFASDFPLTVSSHYSALYMQVVCDYSPTMLCTLF